MGGGEVPSFLVQESGIGSSVAFMCVQEPCKDSQYFKFAVLHFHAGLPYEVSGEVVCTRQCPLSAYVLATVSCIIHE